MNDNTFSFLGFNFSGTGTDPTKLLTLLTVMVKTFLFHLLPTFDRITVSFDKLSNTDLSPAREARREVANLTERENTHPPVYGVKEFVCLSVCYKFQPKLSQDWQNSMCSFDNNLNVLFYEHNKTLKHNNDNLKLYNDVETGVNQSC